MKLARNPKKDLEMFKKKRGKYSISNIKLPEMKIDDKKFRPTKKGEPINESGSLKFDQIEADDEKQKILHQVVIDQLDLVLKNIRKILETKDIEIPGVSVEFIDQIYRFENLNDLSKLSDMDKIIAEQQGKEHGFAIILNQ